MNKLQLLFLGDAKSLPYPAKSFLFLGAYADGPNGMPLLTPECVSTTELETWIEDLKDQLDVIKIEARRKYAAYEARRSVRFREFKESEIRP